MRSADVIYVYGLGASWLVAEDITQKWLRLGKIVSANQDPHITATALAASSKNTVFSVYPIVAKLKKFWNSLILLKHMELKQLVYRGWGTMD